MKVKKEVPAQWRGPVRVTDTKYEIWSYSPQKLGEINKQGQYWHTQDGMRFISSQDASEYMLRVHTMSSKEEKSALAREINRKSTPVSVEILPKEIPSVVSTSPQLRAKAILRKRQQTLQAGSPNRAVTTKEVRIQKLFDAVKELEKEIRDN